MRKFFVELVSYMSKITKINCHLRGIYEGIARNNSQRFMREFYVDIGFMNGL